MSEEQKQEDKTNAEANANARTISQADYDNAVHRARTFEGKLTDFEKKFESVGGIDKALDLISKPKQDDNKKDSSVDVDSIKKSLESDIRKSIQAELDSIKAEKEQVSSKLHTLEVVDKVTGEWSGKFLQSALPLIKEQYIKKYVDKDSEGFLIKDDDGKIRLSGVVRMTTQEFLKEIADRHPDLIQADKAQGVIPKGEVKKAVTSNSVGEIPKGLSQRDLVQWFADKARGQTAN